jgi:hypothetical protein
MEWSKQAEPKKGPSRSSPVKAAAATRSTVLYTTREGVKRVHPLLPRPPVVGRTHGKAQGGAEKTAAHQPRSVPAWCGSIKPWPLRRLHHNRIKPHSSQCWAAASPRQKKEKKNGWFSVNRQVLVHKWIQIIVCHMHAVRGEEEDTKVRWPWFLLAAANN